LTASWSKGRNGRYAYYHCWRQCRAVNVTKSKLEGLFADELKQLQPTPGYMRVVKALVLKAWQERKAEVTRGHRVRRKTVCSNRGNRQRVQVLKCGSKL